MSSQAKQELCLLLAVPARTFQPCFYPRPYSNVEHGTPRTMGNVPNTLGPGKRPSFLSSIPVRASNALGQAGTVTKHHRATTLWPRSLDMQEPGPEKTNIECWLLPECQDISRSRAAHSSHSQSSRQPGGPWGQRDSRTSPPTVVLAHSHETEGQARSVLKPAVDKLWMPWVHFQEDASMWERNCAAQLGRPGTCTFGFARRSRKE